MWKSVLRFLRISLGILLIAAGGAVAGALMQMYQIPWHRYFSMWKPDWGFIGTHWIPVFVSLLLLFLGICSGKFYEREGKPQ